MLCNLKHNEPEPEQCPGPSSRCDHQSAENSSSHIACKMKVHNSTMVYLI